MSRTYADNPENRRVGRVGLPIGSAVISRNTVCGMNTKSYADNDHNRRLGRVGMPHGSAVESKYSDTLTRWNYLDTDTQVGTKNISTTSIPNASQQNQEERYLQLAKELKEKTKQNKKLTHKLDTIQRKNSLLQKQVDIYLKKCVEYQEELHEVKDNVLPERERLLVQLQNQLAETKDDITTLKRITVPVGQLEVLSETTLSRAIQQLQHFYDRDYRSRYDITDKMEVLLQIRLECVMGEVYKHQEIGDRLALVIKTYTSMVKENSNLHRALRTKEGEIKHLKAELRQTKVTKHEMELKFKYMSEE